MTNNPTNDDVERDLFDGLSYEDAMRKAAKLLKRADKAATPQESATAMAMASMIMEKFKITKDAALDSQEEKEPDEKVEHFDKDAGLDPNMGQQMSQWKIELSSCIARAHNCQIYMSAKWQRDEDGCTISRFDSIGRQRGRQQSINLIGRKSDVDTVRYVYRYALEEIARLVARDGVGMGKTWRNNYRLGVVEAIEASLAKAKREMVEELRNAAEDDPVDPSRALVAINSALQCREALAEEVRDYGDRILGLTQRHGGGGAHDYSARLAGREAGKSINLKNQGKVRTLKA